ncbi:hypothetical protein TNIN_156381 [Trichonephila inaurata madagascariensis]|uniref:Uncharacterized protein n=1 Tax=Trichonephila inaurata madagascariensis TaxID=2747483 RepID=A0A8X6X311_9ARAC|nr:hypothetical protein TNIN_156381 [Trichonephila inaurata madagascariensis]
MVNAVIDTGAQESVVRANVVEGQSVNNGGTIQITFAFGEHEMGELKVFDIGNYHRIGVVPISKNVVNDMLICSDYEGLTENSQLVRNPAIYFEYLQKKKRN